MDTESRIVNPIQLRGPQSPPLLDRFQPSRLNTTTNATDLFLHISSKKTGMISGPCRNCWGTRK